jgi:type I restriction enzyme S subunit
MSKESWRQSTIGENLVPLPKSRHLSGASKSNGIYNFYVCSKSILKSDFYDRDDQAVLVSTGGELAVHLTNGKYAYSSDVWAFKGSDDLRSDFLYRWIEFNKNKINYQGFQGSGIKHLDKDYLRKQKFLIPPLAEQKRIASIIANVDNVIKLIIEKNTKLENLKKAVMNKLFSRGIGNHEFVQTKIGIFPSNWKIAPLKSILKGKLRDFGSFSSTREITFLESGIPFIKSEAIKNGWIDFKNISYISKDVHNLLDKSFVNPETILFTKIGSQLGKAAVYKGELGIANSNAATAKIDVDPLQAIPEFIAYQLICDRVVVQFRKDIISLPPRINLNEINELLIPLPPLEEQRKIVDALQSIDNQIYGGNSKIKSYEGLRGGLMQDLLAGKVRVSVN